MVHVLEKQVEIRKRFLLKPAASNVSGAPRRYTASSGFGNFWRADRG